MRRFEAAIGIESDALVLYIDTTGGGIEIAIRRDACHTCPPPLGSLERFIDGTLNSILYRMKNG